MNTALTAAAVTFLLFALAIPAPGVATTVTFSDGDFQVVDWSVATEVLNLGGSVTASQVASGGSLGAYRRIDNTLNSAVGTGVSNSVFAFHKRVGATYDPSVNGAILSIDYSEGSLRVSGGVQACGLALRQAGIIYYGPTFLNPTTFGVWATTTQTGLVAGQFDALAPGVQNPNFSASGGLVEFGFVRANSTSVGGGGGTTVGGIDNWQVTVTVDSPVSVAPSTWGNIKALYRSE